MASSNAEDTEVSQSHTALQNFLCLCPSGDYLKRSPARLRRTPRPAVRRTSRPRSRGGPATAPCRSPPSPAALVRVVIHLHVERFADSVIVRLGSKTTMSASDPGAMVPLRGNSPKIFAGAVDVSSTNRLRVIRPPRHRHRRRGTCASRCRARRLESWRSRSTPVPSALSCRTGNGRSR